MVVVIWLFVSVVVLDTIVAVVVWDVGGVGGWKIQLVVFGVLALCWVNLKM
jgi:hypothetical protein